MYGWHITGRWTGGGSTAEETFLLLTRTLEREEVLVRAGSHLVNRCASECPKVSGKVSVEIVDAEELGAISPQSAGLAAA